MPIRPSEKARYPKEWPEISMSVREAAGHRCEFCGVENYALGAWIGGRWHKAVPKGTGLRDDPRQGETFPCVYGESVVWTRVRRIVLTVAHMDHTPENCDLENLKALCQRCHLSYDAKHHAKNAAATRRAKSPQLDLFDALQEREGDG